MAARKNNKHRSVEVDPTRLCIILCPIGKPGSDVRKKAELLTREIQKAAQSCGLIAKRVDELTEGEEITPAMIRLITTAQMAAADLDGGNSNVHYELGVRHAHGLPALCLMPQCMKGDQEHPGFDIKDISPVYYPPFDPKTGWGGKAKDIREKISGALKKLTAKGTAPSYFLEELQRVCTQRTMKLILKSKMSSLDRFSDGLDRFQEDYKNDFETRHVLPQVKMTPWSKKGAIRCLITRDTGGGGVLARKRPSGRSP